MNLRFTPKAERQVLAIVDHVAKDNPKASLRVLREIRSAAMLLADFPEAGRPGDARTTREWVVHGLPYVIIYRVDRAAAEVAVLEVVHGARLR